MPKFVLLGNITEIVIAVTSGSPVSFDVDHGSGELERVNEIVRQGRVVHGHVFSAEGVVTVRVLAHNQVRPCNGTVRALIISLVCTFKCNVSVHSAYAHNSCTTCTYMYSYMFRQRSNQTVTAVIEVQRVIPLVTVSSTQRVQVMNENVTFLVRNDAGESLVASVKIHLTQCASQLNTFSTNKHGPAAAAAAAAADVKASESSINTCYLSSQRAFYTQ